MQRITCEECGGRITARNVEFKLFGESLGLFPAQVCQKCGEQLFDEGTSDLIDLAAKKKGLWGLSARTKVAKVGTSVGVTINKKIADFMRLKPGEELSVRPETKKRLIIEVA